MPRYLLVLIVLVVIFFHAAAVARAQSAEDEERERMQQQEAVQGRNPLMPQRTQVAFAGNGSADFTPRSGLGVPTPEPNCKALVTPVAFNVQCVSDPDSKSAATCRGTLSLFGFNETRNVSGVVMAVGDAYTMKLSSSDDDLQGCELANVAPVSSTLGNVITMPGCGVNIAGCNGELVGSGADHALTTSGSVILTPSD